MNCCAPLLLAGIALSPLSATAAPADYVETPVVEYGEKEIDSKIGSSSKAGSLRESAFSMGYGWGATERWFTEIILKYRREPGENTKYEALEWENKFQLTETGKYAFEAAILIEVERPNNHSQGWEVKWGPLLQTDIGKVQLNGNALLQRNHRAEQASDTTLFYQWQGKYRWREGFEFGFQGFGEVGKWNHWSPESERKHQIGPAVFGKLHLGNGHDGQAIKYNAAWLQKGSTAAPDHTFRLQIEYEL